jgi:stringent starvation protein B
MLSNRPYLIRAFYQWIVDSNCNPIVVIDANNPRCKIPQGFAEGGEIVFNIAPSAIRDLKMLNDLLEFKASFSGVIHIISAPIKAILAVYAEENGEGIFFDADEDDGVEAGSDKITQLKSISGSLDVREASTDILSEQAVLSDAAKIKPVLRLVE